MTGLVIEYDGEHHRELAQHTADNLREEGLEAAGLAVVRVTSLDLKEQPATVERLRAAYRCQQARDPAKDAWTVGWRPARAA